MNHRQYYRKHVKYDSKQFGVYLDSQLVWDYIEMGKDVDELYPELMKEEIIQEKRIEMLKYVLQEDEQHYFILNGDYVITDLGRVYNCLHKRFLKPEIYKTEIYVNIRFKKQKFSELFKEANWNFDRQVILNRYKQNKWGLINHNNY
jgi:hypothetical protein